MNIFEGDNWRNDPGLKSRIRYKKKFAITPEIMSDGTKIWMKVYYSKYKVWGHDGWIDIETDPRDDWRHGLHEDFIEDITEAEFIVRKLSESL